MDYRTLGHSGLRISTLTLGTMGFGGQGPFKSVGELTVADLRRQLDLCHDAGVNLIDTANMYSRGVSEEIVGEALEGRRDEFMVATKVRFAMGDGPNDAGLSRQHVIASCEASLRRLRADHIDLFQLHEWDGETPPEEYLDALDTLVRDGKVRYVGCSNFTAWQLMKTLSVAERRGTQRFISQQIHYTPQAREAEFELLPAAVEEGIGTMVWSPLAGGLLSGKYRRDRDAPEGSRQLGDWDEPPVYDRELLYDIVEALVEVGEAHGVSGRPGDARLAAHPPDRRHLDHRRPQRGPAHRQPRGGAAHVERRGDRPDRGRQPAQPPLPAVAPGGQRLRSALRRRPGRAGAVAVADARRPAR